MHGDLCGSGFYVSCGVSGVMLWNWWLREEGRLPAAERANDPGRGCMQLKARIHSKLNLSGPSPAVLVDNFLHDYDAQLSKVRVICVFPGGKGGRCRMGGGGASVKVVCGVI